MATVRTFELKELGLSRPHSDVSATLAFVEVDCEKFLQIDTYGSADRQIPGKVSQSLRLSKDAFDELVKLGSRIFE